MAEGVGFEPTLGFPLSLISSQVPSTTQPPFLRLVKSRYFDFAICVFYTAVLYYMYERRSIQSYTYRITLAENACGEPRSPRSIRKLLCPNPRPGQADLEVPQDRPHQRCQTAPERFSQRGTATLCRTQRRCAREDGFLSGSRNVPRAAQRRPLS